jgi:hypothetical protein
MAHIHCSVTPLQPSPSENVTVHIRVFTSPAERVSLNPLSIEKHLQLPKDLHLVAWHADKPEPTANGQMQYARMVLRGDKSGIYKVSLPDLDISHSKGAGLLHISPFYLQVQTPPSPFAAQLVDMKGPFSEPQAFSWWPWMLAATCLVAITFLLWRRWRARKNQAANMPPLSSAEKLRHALAAVHNVEDLSHEHIRAQVHTIQPLFCEVLSQQLGIVTQSKTYSEILQQCHNLAPERQQALRQIFYYAEILQFSPHMDTCRVDFVAYCEHIENSLNPTAAAQESASLVNPEVKYSL